MMPIGSPGRTSPETAFPVLIPIRICSGMPSFSALARTASSIRSAHSTARAGSFSWAGGAPNVAMIASPMYFSTDPSRASTS